MSASDPASAEFFDAMYRTDTDPWGFANDRYELTRYRHVVDVVDPARFVRAFEPGCSVGVLTEMLGHRCGHVDASDLSSEAVAIARRRCAHLRNVTISVGEASDPPGDGYDLIVYSEVGYYRPVDQLEHTVHELAQRLQQHGRFVAAHWLGSSPDHHLHGDEVHAVIERTLRNWQLVHRERTLDDAHVGFRLDVWDRP